MTTGCSSGWAGSVSKLAWRGHIVVSATGWPPSPHGHFSHRSSGTIGAASRWTIRAPPKQTVRSDVYMRDAAIRWLDAAACE
uniref:Uncharacterized protein n=1 Tax=Romanomermis culicivorax TaxID=13658 RepID=A0A915KG16_ROMCU